MVISFNVVDAADVPKLESLKGRTPRPLSDDAIAILDALATLAPGQRIALSFEGMRSVPNPRAGEVLPTNKVAAVAIENPQHSGLIGDVKRGAKSRGLDVGFAYRDVPGGYSIFITTKAVDNA